MKWPTLVTALATMVLVFCPVARGKTSDSCVTYYTSRKPKSVITDTETNLVGDPTGTTTTTITIRDTTTHYPGTVTSTQTTTTTFTYYTTTAPITKTIPTSAGFIPVVSAKNRTTTAAPNQRQRRRPVERRHSRPRLANEAGDVTTAPAVTKSYEDYVICGAYTTEAYELTIDHFDDITKTISATTDSTFITTSTIHTKTTSTVHQSTATVYAACVSGGENNIHRFEHHYINNIFPFDAVVQPQCSFEGSSGTAAQQSPQGCCQAVFENHLGFAWYFHGTPGPSAYCGCLQINSASTSYDWAFTTAESGTVNPPFYVGNGPDIFSPSDHDGGIPYFAGFGPHYRPH